MNNKIIIPFLVAFFLFVSLHLYAQDGSLDFSFDADGIVTTNSGGQHLQSTAIQSDGKIVAVGSKHNGADYDFAVVRYNTDGSMDNTFGINGIVITNIALDEDYGNAIAVQSDGKIVVTGHSRNAGYYYSVIVRYNSDGSLDNTFDSDGIGVARIVAIWSYGASSIVIQPDGKLVVAGGYSTFDVTRYNSDGSLDITFDGDGMVSTSMWSTCMASSIALQSDGKIVVGGKCYSQMGTGTRTKCVMVRYNIDGSLDSTFNATGIVFGPSESGIGIASFSDVAIQSDGKIIGVGNTDYSSFEIIRYHANGTVDTSFRPPFFVNNNDNSRAWAVAIQNNGKILVTGRYSNGTNQNIRLIRYNTDGSLDNSFGINGIVTNDFNGDDIAYDIALQSDGKIVVAGKSNNSFAVVRYNNTVTSIENLSTETAILNSYPNPAREAIIVEIDSRLIASKYLIVNQLGQTLAQGNFDAEKTIIDVQHLTAGVYFLQIEGGEKVVKIVKE